MMENVYKANKRYEIKQRNGLTGLRLEDLYDKFGFLEGEIVKIRRIFLTFSVQKDSFSE